MYYSKEKRIEMAKKIGSRWVVGYVTPGSDTVLWDLVRPDAFFAPSVGGYFLRGTVVEVIEL